MTKQFHTGNGSGASNGLVGLGSGSTATSVMRDNTIIGNNSGSNNGSVLLAPAMPTRP